MYDEMTLEATSSATMRLVGLSWATQVQRTMQRLKQVGRMEKVDRTDALLKRFRRSRPDTYRHSVRVARLTRATGIAFGFDSARLKCLACTGLLHDVGKMMVPESILSRPRKPTRVEYFILHQHPTFGALLASYFNLSPELRIRTQHHHERWDGKGYPHKIGGEDIPIMARIVQVADTYDAMVADRPYRRPLTQQEAVAELRRHEGHQFDPRVIEAFLDSLTAA